MTDRSDETREAERCRATAEGRCAICGDDAEVARVLDLDATTMLARAAIGDRIETIALDLVVDAAEGDLLLVQRGFAIGRVGEGVEQS